MNKRQIDLFHKLDVKFNRLSFREHLIVGEAIKELQKQIEIDAEQIRALQKQNGELTDRCRDLEEKLANADYQLEGRDNEIRELKAQIEKMKNCKNCKNEKIEGACGHFTQVGWCRDWELAD